MLTSGIVQIKIVSTLFAHYRIRILRSRKKRGEEKRRFVPQVSPVVFEIGRDNTVVKTEDIPDYMVSANNKPLMCTLKILPLNSHEDQLLTLKVQGER